MNRLPFILILSVASILSVRSPAQVVGPGGPYIRQVLNGGGLTVTTNGYSSTIANPYTSVGALSDVDDSAKADNYVLAWSASATSHVYVAQGGHDPVTRGAGDIGTLSGQEYAVTTNAVRAAVSGLYLSLADGGTVAGSTTFTEAVAVNAGFTINGDAPLTSENGGEGSAYDADKLDGQHGAYYRNGANITNGTAIAALSATALTAGTIPDIARLPASTRQPVIAFSYRDFTWNTTSGSGWTSYELESGASGSKRTFGLDAISAAAATDQTGTFKSDWVPVPANFAAFKTTGAIKITWVSSQAIVGESELRGIRLISSSDLTGANATDSYTDSTVRDITTSGTPVTVSVNRSAFASSTVPTGGYMCVQIDASVEDGDKLAIISIEVLSE